MQSIRFASRSPVLPARGSTSSARSSRPSRLVVQARNAPGSGTNSVKRQTRQTLDDIQLRTQSVVNDAQASINDATRDVRIWWDEQDEKPLIISIGALGLGVFVLLFRVVDLVDNIPLVSPFLEFVGLAYSLWFIYANLLFRPDRQRLYGEVQNLISRIVGRVEEIEEDMGLIDRGRGGSSSAQSSFTSQSQAPKPRYPTSPTGRSDNGPMADSVISDRMRDIEDKTSSTGSAASSGKTIDRDLDL